MTTTIILEDAGSIGGMAPSIEKSLLAVQGVLKAHVNLITEAVYVEYDAARCNPEVLETAVEALGVRTRHASVPFASTYPSYVELWGKQVTGRSTGLATDPSCTWWVFAGVLAIASSFAYVSQRMTLFGAVPYVLVVAIMVACLSGRNSQNRHERRNANRKSRTIH